MLKCKRQLEFMINPRTWKCFNTKIRNFNSGSGKGQTCLFSKNPKICNFNSGFWKCQTGLFFKNPK